MFTKHLEPFWTALRQSYSGLQAPWQSVIIVRCRKHSACFCGQFEEDTMTLCLCHTAKKEEKLKEFQLEFWLICRNCSVHRNYEAWRSRRICFSQRIQVPLHQNSSLVNLCGVGGTVSVFPNTGKVTLQFKTSSACLLAWRNPCRGAGIAKAGKLNQSLEKPLGTTAKKVLVKGDCISVSVPIMWV